MLFGWGCCLVFKNYGVNGVVFQNQSAKVTAQKKLFAAIKMLKRFFVESPYYFKKFCFKKIPSFLIK